MVSYSQWTTKRPKVNDECCLYGEKHKGGKSSIHQDTLSHVDIAAYCMFSYVWCITVPCDVYIAGVHVYMATSEASKCSPADTRGCNVAVAQYTSSRKDRP